MSTQKTCRDCWWYERTECVAYGTHVDPNDSCPKWMLRRFCDSCSTSGCPLKNSQIFEELKTWISCNLYTFPKIDLTKDELKRLKEILGIYEVALKRYAERENWGYIDESGCAKGHGKYIEACFLGPELAKKALAEGKRGL